LKTYGNELKDEIIRAHPELVTMGDSGSAMDYLIKCAKEAWEGIGLKRCLISLL